MMKKTLAIIYVVVLIVMGAATFVEAAKGTTFAHRHFYGAWWFTALWAALAILGAAYMAKSATLWRKRNWNIVLLHASMLIILAGALLTHIYGRTGTVHLRLNEPQDIAIISHNGETYTHRLRQAVELTRFEIVEDEEGRVTDYKSEFRIGDEDGTVSMNKIHKHGNIRFYQMSYDSDLRGSTLMINRDPYGIPVTYCGYALLFFSFICLCIKKRHPLRVWLPTIAIAALWCIWYFVLDGSWAQIPVLRSPLLFAHVIIIILGYALLLIQTCISAWALIRRKGTVATSVLLPALCLLAIGIFLGAVWANISWGNYWSWDSKEVWALITLMVYAVPAHRRSLPIFNKPRVFHCYMLFSLLTVLMTYFGVNYFLTGLHSYGSY